jgi:hypothetical protein
MISKELYFFDCWGLYHARNVFNSRAITHLNQLFDKAMGDPPKTGIKVHNVFASDPAFLYMLFTPTIMQICRLCFGSEYRLDHAFGIHQTAQSNVGTSLHGKPFGKNMAHYYLTQGCERLDTPCWTRTGQLSVGIVLHGQTKETGGFCYIPGSHKSSYFASGQHVHEKLLDEKTFAEHVVVPDLNPGDVIAMPECLIHGQTVMRSGMRRIMYNMMFPLSIKFMDFSAEQAKLKAAGALPEYLSLLDSPSSLLETNDGKIAVQRY